MKRLIAGLFGATLLLSTLGVTAASAGPENGKAGPNGHNDFGLCTAASNGEKKGWTDGALPPPFGGPDGDWTRDEFLEEVCNPFPTPGGK